MRGLILPFILALSTLSSTSGCPRPGPVLSPTAPACGNMCETLAHYGCEEGKPKSIGLRLRTCLERCTTVEQSGYMSVEPECVVAHAQSLAEIRSVCRYECKDGKP